MCYIGEGCTPMVMFPENSIPAGTISVDEWVKIQYAVAKIYREAASCGRSKTEFVAALQEVDEKFFRPKGYSLSMAEHMHGFPPCCCCSFCGSCCWRANLRLVVLKLPPGSTTVGVESATSNVEEAPGQSIL